MDAFQTPCPSFPVQEVEEWLRRHDLYDEWHLMTLDDNIDFQGAESFPDADYVARVGRGLYTILSFAEDDPLAEEFEDLCLSHGFSLAVSSFWYVGFYRDEGQLAKSTAKSYREKLQDPRWQRKAGLVRARAGQRCQDCGSQKPPLQAHHCWYRYGLEPWRYPLDALRCLCGSCHQLRHEAEHGVRTVFSRLSTLELQQLAAAMTRLADAHDRTPVLSQLAKVGVPPVSTDAG
jgi:hypothetical protein